MIQINRKHEDRLRSEGYIKLRDKNSDRHRFKYLAPYPGSMKSIVCIEHGSVYGVYIGQNWEEKYIPVDWNTPDCDCDMCKLNEAAEEMGIISKDFSYAIRNMNNLDNNTPIDIYGLNITKEKNGWNKVSFYYKIQDEQLQAL